MTPELPAEADTWFPVQDGLPRFDSEQAERWVALQACGADAWRAVAVRWLEELQDPLGEQYVLYEDPRVLFLSAQDVREAGKFRDLVVDAQNTVDRALSWLSPSPNDRILVVLLLDSLDRYYDYVQYFYSEAGQFATSGGMCINQGYPHLVFPSARLGGLVLGVVHELAHARVAHLPLPGWLNEGLARNVERVAYAFGVPDMNAEMADRHQAFWGTEEMQEFWTGDSFHRPDDGNELSYSLADLLVQQLSQRKGFHDFVTDAHEEDAGEAAAIENLGEGLGEIVGAFLGPGTWSPRPKRPTE